jgi:hypothetical protein
VTLLGDYKTNTTGVDKQKVIDMKTDYVLTGPYNISSIQRPDKIVGMYITFYEDCWHYLNPGEELDVPGAIRWAKEEGHFVLPDTLFVRVGGKRKEFDNSGERVDEGVRVLRQHMDLAYLEYDVDEDVSWNGFDENYPTSNIVAGMTKFSKDTLDVALKQGTIKAFEDSSYQQQVEKYSRFVGTCKRIRDGANVLNLEVLDVNNGVDLREIEFLAYELEYDVEGESGTGTNYLKTAFENYQNRANVRLAKLAEIAKSAFGEKLGIDPDARPLEVYRIVKEYNN